MASFLARPLRASLRPLAHASPLARAFSATRPSPFSRSPAALEVDKVARKPASQDLSHMGKNAAEEAKGVGRVVAEAIAGANGTTSQQAPKENLDASGFVQDLNSIKSLAEQLPRETVTWGAAGLLPYAGTSVAAIHFARQAYLASEAGKTGIELDTAMALLDHVNLLQVQYGAVLLSFLGAVHWGFEWSKFGGVHGNARYLLGIAPVLAGWSTLLIPGHLALVGQWAAFFAMWYADQRATMAGWAPKWYSTYRFWLTSIVGGSILVSLAAQGYYAVDPQLVKEESQLQKLKEGKPPRNRDENAPIELGPMKASKDTSGDAYVQFVNVEKERKKKEEEEEKAKEEEAQKQKEQDAEAKKQAGKDKQTEEIKKVEDK
ncbi:hypothetical protein JCM21900_005475 [Sporobolomyces salmonicolor]